MVKRYVYISVVLINFVHNMYASGIAVREMEGTNQRLLSIGQQIAQLSAQSSNIPFMIVKSLDRNTVVIEAVTDEKIQLFFKKGIRILTHYNETEFVGFLTDWVPYIDCKDQQGESLLHKATRLGVIKAIKELYDKGASIDAKNKEGLTPLHIASETGNYAMAAELIARRAEILEDKDGNIPLHLACSKGHKEIAALFLRVDESQVNAKNNNDDSPLIKAAHFGRTAIVDLLLSKKADVNLQNKQGDTALNRAIIFQENALVDLLLKRGANVHLVNEAGQTALSKAFFQCIPANNIAIINMILEYFDINFKHADGKTALHFAALHGLLDQSRQLLKRGADANAPDAEGRTPLHYAARSNGQMVSLLLNNRARSFLRDKHGYLPLHHAVEGKNKDALNILLQVEGVDVNAQDAQGRTPLHIAAQSNATAIPCLLARKANSADKDDGGCTPLHFAALSNNANALETLLKSGASVNARNNLNETALHLAAANGFKNIVEILLRYKIDVYANDNHARRASRVAQERNHTESVKILDNAEGCCIQ